MSPRSVSRTTFSGTRRQQVGVAVLQRRVRDLERECAQLRAENKKLASEKAAAERHVQRLQAEVARLKTQLEASQRGGKRQAAPYSKGPPKKNPKRPGRKSGPD